MRAFVVTAPGEAGVEEVPEPVAAPGEVVVEVERAGVCGTDVEIFTGEMAYLHDGRSSYPLRLGHEWCGTVTEVGPGVDAGWRGRRVTGDTMIGCGRCRRCLAGFQHTCDDRQEVGIRAAGRCARRAAGRSRVVPARPAGVRGRHPRRARRARGQRPAGRARGSPGARRPPARPRPGHHRLAGGPVRAGRRRRGAPARHGPRSLAFARSLGVAGVWTADDLPDLPFDAVVDASNAAGPAARASSSSNPASASSGSAWPGRPAWSTLAPSCSRT